MRPGAYQRKYGMWDEGDWAVVLGVRFRTFFKKRPNFAILQASRNLLEEIDRLHSGVIGVANNDAPSFRKIPERSSMPGALLL